MISPATKRAPEDFDILLLVSRIEQFIRPEQKSFN